jgi:DNA-binding PadR family transcriptional regulator
MGHTLGEFEQLILLALARLGDDAYGVTVQEEIARRAKRETSLGAVYKTLLRLEDKGLVESWAGAPSARRGGRRKKQYRIAPAGARELKRSLAALRGMTRGLSPHLELP